MGEVSTELFLTEEQEGSATDRVSRTGEEEQVSDMKSTTSEETWTGNAVKEDEGQMGQPVKVSVVRKIQTIKFEAHKTEQQSTIREGSSVLTRPDTSSNTGSPGVLTYRCPLTCWSIRTNMSRTPHSSTSGPWRWSLRCHSSRPLGRSGAHSTSTLMLCVCVCGRRWTETPTQDVSGRNLLQLLQLSSHQQVQVVQGTAGQMWHIRQLDAVLQL